MLSLRAIYEDNNTRFFDDLAVEKKQMVLTKFLFTDLSFSKRKPAVTISKVIDSELDVIVPFIFSVPKKTGYILETTHKDFNQTGLKKTSVFKNAANFA